MPHFIEVEHFGWNVITATFLATTFFGVYGAIGLVHQIKRINLEGAGSVSVTWTMTFAFMFVPYLAYGLETEKLAVTLQFFLRVPFYIVLMRLLYEKLGGFSRLEWAQCGFLTLSLGGMYINLPALFLGLSWLGALSTIAQPLQIWNKKSSRSVSVKLLWALATSGAFWLAYALATNDLYIALMMGAYLIIHSTTIVLYYLYKEPVRTT